MKQSRPAMRAAPEHGLLLLAAMLLAAGGASASTTARLPRAACAPPDSVFQADFEPVPARYAEPSGGSGGIPGYGWHELPAAGGSYHVFVPEAAGDGPLPLLLVLHGAAGSPAAAFEAAWVTRDAWVGVARRHRVAIAAPVASGASGGWRVPADYELLRAVIADLSARHDIDASRLYGWGFSAGGHVLHDLVLDTSRPGIDLHAFAGYAVSAGAMAALACSSTFACDALLAGLPRQLPIAIQVGRDDPLLPYARSDHARLLAQGWQPLLYRETAGGHDYVEEDLERSWQFLCPFQRLP